MSESRARQIERNVTRLRQQLAPFAASWAARYNGPVHLVGSVLYNPAPRDVDIRIVVPDYEFAARYGTPIVTFEKPVDLGGGVSANSGVAEWRRTAAPQRWIDDVAKFSGAVCVAIAHNVDIQVWARSWWRNVYPGTVILAAPSPKWWVENRYTKQRKVSGQTTEDR